MADRLKEQLAKLLDRDLPEDDGIILRTMLGLPESITPTDATELPPVVVRLYWVAKQTYDRAGVSMNPYGLCQVVTFYRYGNLDIDMVVEETDAKPATLQEAWKNKDVQFGDPIEIKFRNRWVRAKIQTVSPDGEVVHAIIDDGKDESQEVRKIKAVNTRLITHGREFTNSEA